MLSIGSYESTMHLCTVDRRRGLVAMITHRLEEIRGFSMPKLRAEAMNAGVDADDLALGVEFERTLSANSKLLKQSSKFEVDDDFPADPEDREEIIEKIFQCLKDRTKQYAPPPEVQAILDAQHGPVMVSDDADPAPPTIVDAAVSGVDAGSNSAALAEASKPSAAASETSADRTQDPDPERPPPGEFLLAQLAPDMIRAVCTHL
eukprot:COSAG02_NODE_27179_length_615_cov_1.292636_1_plen_204_part_11